MPTETTFDLEQLLSQLPAASRAEAPSMPVKNLVRESAQLVEVLGGHHKKFLALPDFSPDELARAEFLSKSLEAAERAWVKVRAREAASAKAATSREEALGFKRDAMAAGRYLLRKDRVAVERLNLIAEGDNSVADLVDDLKALAEILDEHPERFAVDPRLPKEPGTAARTYAKVLTGIRDTGAANEALARRNQIASLLEASLAEIRAAARYLFRDDPKMLAKVQSAYRVQKARKTRERKSPAA